MNKDEIGLPAGKFEVSSTETGKEGLIMMDIPERRAVKLNWSEVCHIVSEEIRKILGLCIQCKINVVENSLWDVTFIDYRLPLPKLCQLLQVTHPTPEDWEDTLPDEGGVDVGGLGIVLAEKLISRHLGLIWEHHLITEDSLWLVGVTERTSTGDNHGGRQ